MSETEHAVVEQKPKPEQAVEISVNFNRVVMSETNVTGLEIKIAAINQGVKIKPDFILYEMKDGKRRHRIPDDKKVHLHEGDKFEAVPDDDNS